MNAMDKLKKRYSDFGQYVSSNTPERLKSYVRKYCVPFSAVFLCILVLVLIFWPRSTGIEEAPDFGELPDFSVYTDVNQMKADFYDYLQPIVEYHNRRILVQRDQLQECYNKLEGHTKLGSRDKGFIRALAKQYEYELPKDWSKNISGNPGEHPFHQVYRQLMLRVDEIPVDLALVQAAKESGWGRSRFAVQANNLFGQWCYSPGCGLVPKRRGADATHEVQKFESVADAIGSYMNNLNSHASYETLRLIRAGLRSVDSPVKGMALADGLIYYSQRREAYVDEVKTMIHQYHDFQSARQTDN